MNNKIALLFAGQGSQYVGMGKDLYEAFPESKAVFAQADRILGFSLSRLCFAGPQEKLTQTQNCQSAILVTSIAAFKAFTVYRLPFTVEYVAGLSLGEYSALVAAEAISLEDAVYLVRKRGEFMEEQAQASPGSMASILGLDLASVRDICSNTGSELANINCPGQIVISGAKDEVDHAVKLAEEKGAQKAILLEVSGAFHSSLMQGASLKLARELEKIRIDAPKISVVSNVTAKPVTQPQEIRENLIRQVTAGVLWEDSMRFILSEGITKFFEFGPGRVLKSLMRRIDERAQVINIEKKEDILKISV